MNVSYMVEVVAIGDIVKDIVADKDTLSSSEKETTECVHADAIAVINRVNVVDQAPPRIIKEMKSHPEHKGYFAALVKELDASKRTGNGNLNVPADLDIYKLK